MSQLGKVFIGPITRDPSESVGSVNEALIAALEGQFQFTGHVATRKTGNVEPGKLSPSNGLIMLRHGVSWFLGLVARRPNIAHYAITSRWNMEKSLAFLQLGRLFGAKTVGHLHGGGFIEHWQGLGVRRRAVAGRMLRSLDALVVLSEAWKERVVQHLGLLPEQVHVVYNPVDKTFENAALNFEIGHPDDGSILCFGVMGRQKGLFEILEAASRLPRQGAWKFLLVGPDREPGISEDARNFIAAHHMEDRVKLLGPVHGERKLALFNSAAIFLLPSHVENFPVTVLEAMAAGLAVIATPVGAIPEFLVNGQSGLFVAREAPDQIAAAVGQLLGDAAMRNRLATQARQTFVSRLNREHISQQLAAVYHAVLPVVNDSPRA